MKNARGTILTSINNNLYYTLSSLELSNVVCDELTPKGCDVLKPVLDFGDVSSLLPSLQHNCELNDTYPAGLEDGQSKKEYKIMKNYVATKSVGVSGGSVPISNKIEGQSLGVPDGYASKSTKSNKKVGCFKPKSICESGTPTRNGKIYHTC